ncbi:hypothetical protein L758_11630 [Mycobacterium tuberculosis TRS1]|nr:hypothetical protein M943_11185 [Mycobacterium tuberculosis EAI5]AIH52160.1 hypothetical protein IQ38_09180 [Mycobacterium tuberculosis]AQN82984.1 hypothetical protein L766_11610 [Mycobacterium tuberculosis TRS9]AQN86871.1 hypothetical protein L787_11555 [Mycobacterium tuberculosis 1821ADB35]AQN90762.1 hypothetical protein L789_11520 [Mycobacterium tuberculosis 1821ADB37]AQN94649.1 hypothetical protein L790_11600 [Mycobacterium tuberculosis 1821ADB38]AQN98539.1 hypothetical protein L792_11
MHEGAHPVHPGRRCHRGSHDLGFEHAHGGLDGRQLQLLLGAEMPEQARLAHAQPPGKLADGQPREPLHRGDIHRGAQDLRPGLAADVGARHGF